MRKGRQNLAGLIHELGRSADLIRSTIEGLDRWAKELAERFKLNQEEQNYVLTAQKGEGLLFAHNDRIPVTIVASEEEHYATLLP